ncbi:hypothetical protein BPMI_00566 [Candidatus Burkholderia pumila]|uniref:Uncharacterized protein n=1 Tax=Candidatus Burkholderia pumila TaxID=1090375 RepID=A0ABR5HKH9_9BURK|nr:hypothetical protein BPMI_00566 [Candidatus Burkholderia pumila]
MQYFTPLIDQTLSRTRETTLSILSINDIALRDHLREQMSDTLTQRPKCGCGAPVYELAFCDDCKTPHLLAEDSNGQFLQRSPYANDEFEVSYEGNGEDQPDASASCTSLRRPSC